MTAKEDTVARNDLSRLQKHDVPNDELVHADLTLDASTDDLDGALVLLRVEDTELTLLLPVVDRADKDLRAPMRSMMGRKIPNERVWKVSKNESSAQ